MKQKFPPDAKHASYYSHIITTLYRAPSSRYSTVLPFINTRDAYLKTPKKLT